MPCETNKTDLISASVGHIIQNGQEQLTNEKILPKPRCCRKKEQVFWGDTWVSYISTCLVTKHINCSLFWAILSGMFTEWKVLENRHCLFQNKWQAFLLLIIKDSGSLCSGFLFFNVTNCVYRNLSGLTSVASAGLWLSRMEANMLMLRVLAVPSVIMSFTSDPGVSSLRLTPLFCGKGICRFASRVKVQILYSFWHNCSFLSPLLWFLLLEFITI